MKKSIKLLSTLVVALFLFTLAPKNTANATTGPHFWQGYLSTGLMITNEECPIEVENENLVFNVDSFPQMSKNGETETTSTVTAEYTFYNPTDYTVEASLAFPFGQFPSYGYNYNKETGEYEMIEEDFLVSVDGEEIEKSIRHTISYNNYKYYNTYRYSNGVEPPKLIDGFVKDDFYSPDLPVYEYKFSLDCEERYDPPYHSAIEGYFYTSFRWKKKEGVRLFHYIKSYETKKTDDYTEIVFGFRGKTDLSLYFIGGQPEIQPSWAFYNSPEIKDENEVVGTANLISVKEIDFYTLLMKPYKEEYGVSENDWYNALTYEFNESYDAEIGRIYNHSSRKLFVGTPYFLMSENFLMRWCYYKITLQPKQRIVNTVTVPLYPDKNTSYTPAIYTYHYLVSPAKNWKNFKKLNIKIVTPYELVKSEGFNFVKHPTQNEYNLSLSGLPDGELTFILSTENRPIDMYKRRGCFSSLNQGGLMISFLLITTACFYIFKNKKK